MQKARKIWAVGLASLALGLIMVGGASAAQFTAEPSEPVVPITALAGSQVSKNKMTMHTGYAECSEVNIAGEIFTSTATESFELTPSYGGCTTFGFNSTFTPNGCKYKVYAGGTTIDLVCPEGKDLLLDTAFNACNVTIQPQTGLSSVTLTSGTWKPEAGVEKPDLLIDLNITNLKYTEVGFACAQMGKATTGGKLEGSLTVTARDAASKGPQGISLDP